MTDVAEAAVAAPEPVAATETQTPEPLNTEMAGTKEHYAKQERDSFDAAFDKASKAVKEKAEAAEKAKPEKTVDKADPAKAGDPKQAKQPDKSEVKPDQKVEAKPDEKEKPEPATRGEDGKFKAKEPAQEEGKAPTEDAGKQPSRFVEAPKRFSDDAKAEWESAPEAVKAEVHRAVSEMEKGLNQYREVVEPLRPYIQLAQQHGVRVEQAMDNYINLEKTLLSDPERGLQMVADYAGINLREYAAKLLNQSPDEVQAGQDNTVRELRSEVSHLKQMLSGVTQTMQQQQLSQSERQVQDFATQHPRFDELAEDIKFFLQSGRAQDLPEAYELAERLNPAPAPKASPQPVDAPAPAPTAQTPKGNRSIAGAPNAGSSPAKQPPAKDIDEALRRAFARAG